MIGYIQTDSWRAMLHGVAASHRAKPKSDII
jgi:hypothetical protein